MTRDDRISLMSALPPGGKLRRGLFLAIALWILFLVGTAYTSIATLFDRVASTDVMEAASQGVWSGKIGWQIASFLAVVVLLHLWFALMTWVLAVATSTLHDVARRKFGRIVVGWFALLAGSALIYNALWYPRTLLGAYYYDALSMSVLGIPIGRIVYVGAFALAAIVLLAAAFRAARRVMGRPAARSWATATTLVLLLVGAWQWLPAVSDSSVAAVKPHIILVGIDSLRLDQLSRFGGGGVTPNLDKFLQRADVFKDSTTPLARTFSSWTAILTGRSPTVTGARYNLAERSLVSANPTVADVLREHGYRTVYSTDEVRFANIDQTFGFDEVITPKIGAADFLVGTYNELPLSSMVINTRLGRYLFPFSYANRGVATMFQPSTYLDWLDRELSFDKPTLLIAHLTAAHWPYYTSETPFGVSKRTAPHDRPMYRIGLQTADRMFGILLETLERKGALQNALVIVLSDHGEAMALPNDSFFDSAFHVEGLGSPLRMLDVGHGQSVLSQSQYRILLGFRQFGESPVIGLTGRDMKFPATAEDIAPTILDFLGVEGDPLTTSGRSLLGFLVKSETPSPADLERIRFTETDLSVLPGPGGGVDEVATARKNSMFFMVDPQTGRLHINSRYAPLAKSFKERAAFTNDALLAVMPAGPRSQQYLYFDFSQQRGRLLLTRPQADGSPEQRLWDALHDHYKGELYQPVRIGAEDWPVLSKEWADYVASLKAQQPH